MILTTAQLATLKADVLADGTLSQIDRTHDDGLALIAAAYNVVDNTFNVYATAINVQDIFNQISWANLTPNDLPDGTQLWANRSLACQGKQFNLQLLLQGQQATINGAKASVRAGLQDALTNVPSSSAAGSTVSAGWVPVRDGPLARKATRGERLFATGGNGSTPATAATMQAEGQMTGANIGAAFS